MSIRVLCFASVSEITGVPALEMSHESDLDTLLTKLKEIYPALRELTFSIAVNKKISQGNVELAKGDVVALLPAFSGG